MDLWLLLQIALSLVSIGVLLGSPYLRITSLGWCIAIIFIPFFGAIFFLLTVVRARKQGHDEAFCHLRESCHKKEEARNIYERLGQEYDFLPYSRMLSSSILRDDDFVDAVYSLVDTAEKRIWITTYILGGEVKQTLLEKLLAAHERGVDVRLIVDRVGSGLLFNEKEEDFTLEDMPFAVSVFHQSRIRSLFFVEKRLHSKILIADDQGLVGAHNLRDEVLDHHQQSVDNVSILFSGSVVLQLSAVFKDLWFLNSSEKLSNAFDELIDTTEHEQKPLARIIFSDPIERFHNYNRYLNVLFHAAKKRIYIWMPYIIPSQVMRSSIICASKMGLDVKVLMPEVSDSKLVDNAHALVLKEFHDNGVPCALSKGDFDHSKILIIDDIAIIGSTNLDYRSLYRNYEANIEINDEHFTNNLAHIFDHKFKDANSQYECHAPLPVHMYRQLTSLIAALY